MEEWNFNYVASIEQIWNRYEHYMWMASQQVFAECLKEGINLFNLLSGHIKIHLLKATH